MCSAPMLSAVENILAAWHAEILPDREFFLQGSVLDSAVEVLLQRLRGLCDNVESEPETFQDHEMCFRLTQASPYEAPTFLRVRRALDYPDMPWHLRYIGRSEMGDDRQAIVVRSTLDIDTSSTIVDFLMESGCKLDYQCAIKGFIFRKGLMKVTVSKIYTITQVKKYIEDTDALSQSHLVELSVLASKSQEGIGDAMHLFAEHLKPLVQLEKSNSLTLQYFRDEYM